MKPLKVGDIVSVVQDWEQLTGLGLAPGGSFEQHLLRSKNRATVVRTDHGKFDVGIIFVGENKPNSWWITSSQLRKIGEREVDGDRI